jgi:hypothetical protein
MKECPKNCKAKMMGAMDHVTNPECVWRENDALPLEQKAEGVGNKKRRT